MMTGSKPITRPERPRDRRPLSLAVVNQIGTYRSSASRPQPGIFQQTSLPGNNQSSVLILSVGIGSPIGPSALLKREMVAAIFGHFGQVALS